MLTPHRQQSAVINHSRTDIGALQSGHPHRTVSPSSQNRARPGAGLPAGGENEAATIGWSNSGNWPSNAGSSALDWRSNVGTVASGLVGSGALVDWSGR
jgi:hypothetical protein